MKKIAVCLPSYNESQNIKKITKKVDKALGCLGNNNLYYIVNCDNNSPDFTNQIFKQTKTKFYKVSIISLEQGKGINIINFMDFCIENDIDYGFVFDSDLKSFRKSWIKKMLNSLKRGCDFILPLYKRSKFEGNTTNHFVVPILYALYGKFIRQPIGGDYGFSKKYIKKFNCQSISNEIKKYGIDIYMVLLAINNGFIIDQVVLGRKIHSPSFNKINKIFLGVSEGLKYSLIKFKPNKDFNFNDKKIDNYIGISNKIYASFYKKIIKKYFLIIKNCNFNEVYNDWIKYMSYYILNFKNISNEKLEEMSEIFMRYVLLFWKEFRFKSNVKCENQIRKLSIQLKERYERGD